LDQTLLKGMFYIRLICPALCGENWRQTCRNHGQAAENPRNIGLLRALVRVLSEDFIFGLHGATPCRDAWFIKIAPAFLSQARLAQAGHG
jgi:hypothetical protein